MVLQGLTTGHDAPLEVREGGIAGRGVFATGAIPKRSWVCEYKAGAVYPPSEKDQHTTEYDLNGKGSYVIETYIMCIHQSTQNFDCGVWDL